MTILVESSAASAEQDTPFNSRWRQEAERAQEAVVPSGRVVVSCSAPLGGGGLGRHMQEVVGALDRREQQSVQICEASDGSLSTSPRLNPRIHQRRRIHPSSVMLAPLARIYPSWRLWIASMRFDADAARRLPPADHLIAFNGTADAQFHAARRARYNSLCLVSATSHLGRVAREHARAYRQYPLERPWAQRLVARNLAEYRQADCIYVSTRHIWESFVEEGFPEDALSLFPLTPDPRYRREGAPRSSPTFDVVYVGGLTVPKGVPLLVEAVRRLSHSDMRLLLVGGWATRGMRRFIQRACAEDARIKVCPGDPLPYLRAARLYVHPSYQDGFGYAPAEALACGVPLIVSESTGMKELVDPGRTGLIVPTGDLGALTEAIDACYRAEILRG
jgi:glycosyltransferase involved in cell wall biosynthesis